MKRNTSLHAIERRLDIYSLIPGNIEKPIKDYPVEYKFVLKWQVKGDKLTVPATSQWPGRLATHLNGLVAIVPLDGGVEIPYGVELDRDWKEVEYREGVPQVKPEVARAIYSVANCHWTDVKVEDLLMPYKNMSKSALR